MGVAEAAGAGAVLLASGVGGFAGSGVTKRNWYSIRTPAISTAARIARFSIRRLVSSAGCDEPLGGDHTPLGSTDDTGQAAGWQATCPARIL